LPASSGGFGVKLRTAGVEGFSAVLRDFLEKEVFYMKKTVKSRAVFPKTEVLGKPLALAALALVFFGGCGGRGPVLLTPQNQAGTRSVVLPDYTPVGAADAGPADAAPAVLSAELPADEAPVKERVRAKPESIDLEIREKLFIAQTNEVYLNPEDYLGKTIKLEGLFKVEQYVGEDKRYCFVLRYGPGCCGNDGSAGFEVAWGPPQPYTAAANTLPSGPAFPEEDAWVEAVGVLAAYEEDGYPYIYLDLFALTEKAERGAEFVTQ
jgi:hypothetical protein